MKISIAGFCPLFFIALLFLYSPISMAKAEILDEERQATYQQLEIFSSVLSILQENYVEEIDTKEVITGAINGLLFSLDPHSSYLSPDGFREIQEETKGSFSGIGIEVTIKNELLTIVSPIADTPADKAGLRAKDVIIAIDGEKTRKMGGFEAIKKLRGAVGSEVRITIHRQGWESPRDFTLKRGMIPLHSVRGDFISPGFAHIRITNFQSHTAADFKLRLDAMAKNHPIEGLILDLRNNPGGLLQQAVIVTDTFLSEGVIVSTKGRRSDQNNIYRAKANSQDLTFPMVVLVNEGSASASEIVAGALKAHKRAIIIGTRTFGKGSVQTIIPLADGAGLRMTTARYYTPDGQSIQAVGIEPDVEVPFIACTPEMGQAPKKLSEADLKNHLMQPKKSPEKNALRDKIKEDNQLRSAYNILKSLQLLVKNS